MTLLFILGVAIVLGSIVLVGSALSSTTRAGGVTRSPAVLDAMTTAPKELISELDLAGSPKGWTVDRVLSGKVTVAVAGLFGGLVFSIMLNSTAFKLIVVVGGVVAGFCAANFYLYQKTYERSEKIQRELPDAIDLLTISVESGLGSDAVQQVSLNADGPLSEEFSRVLREMRMEQGRADSLRAMGERRPAVLSIMDSFSGK